MITLKNCRLIALAASAVFAVNVGFAQQDNHHEDPASRAAMKVLHETIVQAEKIVNEARPLLLQKKYGEVLERCDRALSLMQTTGLERGSAAHDLIAECYLAQGQFDLSLKEASIPEASAESRITFTKAIAFVKLGRPDAAMALLSKTLGQQKQSSGFRKRKALWETPIDRGSSSDQLLATAYLLRGIVSEGLGEEWVEQDFAASLKLAPKNPSANLALGKYLFNQGKQTVAKLYLENARDYGKDKRTIERAKSYLDRIKAKAGADAPQKIKDG